MHKLMFRSVPLKVFHVCKSHLASLSHPSENLFACSWATKFCWRRQHRPSHRRGSRGSSECPCSCSPALAAWRPSRRGCRAWTVGEKNYYCQTWIKSSNQQTYPESPPFLNAIPTPNPTVSYIPWPTRRFTSNFYHHYRTITTNYLTHVKTKTIFCN